MKDVFIIMTNCRDSRALYEELRPYNMNVTEVGVKVYIYGRVDSDKRVDWIYKICGRHGKI